MEYNPQNGEVTLPIGGRDRTLAFTMGALLMFSNDFPGGIVQAFEALENNSLEAIVSYSYRALKAKASVNALPPDFSPELCTEWIAEMALTPGQAPCFAALGKAIVQSIQALGNRMGLAATTNPEASPLPATT